MKNNRQRNPLLFEAKRDSKIPANAKIAAQAFLLLLLFAANAFAIKAIAVLEIVPNESVSEQITIEESRHLTDELRRQAVSSIQSDGYAILTRDNILSLMPPDEEEAECLAEGCAVDIGRAIGAEYVAQGTVGKFGKKLTLSIELYETMGAKLIGSIIVESEDIDGLLAAIRREANPLFAKIEANENVVSNAKAPTAAKAPAISVPAAAPAPISLELPDEEIYEAVRHLYIPPRASEAKKGINWLAWAVDLIGAGVLAYGFLQDREAVNLYNDSYIKNDYSPNNPAENDWKQIDNAKKKRNIGYLTGGLILASGISLHIWF